jgi:GNAT superfamily N-acetyltransferase
VTRLKIRLADWRDREHIQSLRRLLKRPVDGGLYELLNWPMYHCHVALVDDEPVGFSSVALYLHGLADDVGTVVLPRYRRQGIGTQLRATQVRDLLLMGMTALFCAAPMSNPASIQWCTKLFGSPLGSIESAYLDPHLYFGAILPTLAHTLKGLGIRDPFPLSDLNVDRLLQKHQRAMQDTARLQALGDFNMRKAVIRQET